MSIEEIRAAILSGTAESADYTRLPLPESYRAVTVHADETGMFEGRSTNEKDPRESVHLDEVPVPELGPGEALVAVMASAINYNTVWTSIFEPVPTFAFLRKYGRLSELAKRNDLPYHVIGSDLAGVVSSRQKAEICRSMGAELIIDRNAEGYRFWSDPATQDPKERQRFGARIRELTGGEDPDIVFEHPGRETFGASVYVARRGGTVVTCASTTGFQHEYDNRYLWMNLKRIIGSHFANYREAWEANRLIRKGMIHPTLSRSYPLSLAGQAAFDVHRNLHQGKVGVLCLAPGEGLGVRDNALRDRHRSEIDRFRDV